MCPPDCVRIQSGVEIPAVWQSGVQEILAAYQGAHTQKDMAALARVWPSISGADSMLLGTKFRQSGDFLLEIEVTDAVPQGDGRLLLIWEQRETLGEKKPREFKYQTLVAQSGGEEAWQIVERKKLRKR